MDTFVKILKEKEQELRRQLEKTPIFKQWESVSTTLAQFANNGDSEPVEQAAQTTPDVPARYDLNLTWKQRVLYSVSELGQASVADISKFMKDQGEPKEMDFLVHRVGLVVSDLRHNDQKLLARFEGKKGYYYLKK